MEPIISYTNTKLYKNYKKLEKVIHFYPPPLQKNNDHLVLSYG